MASEDVIELGSSDEDAEPPSKKRKPIPNAMVHIPTILPGITIKPAKPSRKTIPMKGVPMKPTLSKGVKVNFPSNIIVNPFGNRFIRHINPMQIPGNTIVSKQMINHRKEKDNFTINPISINNIKFGNNTKKSTQNTIKKVNQKPGPTVLNNLPSSITIKKTSTIKPINIACISGLGMKNITAPLKPNLGNVFTVNLDENEDDNTNSSTASPQWYLRPEEEMQTVDEPKDQKEEHSTLEEENNKEPESTKYVEIVIEDSPIKPPQNQPVNDINRTMNEIGMEVPITIEDSPCKRLKEKSQSEGDNIPKNVPNSKKKLDYPNGDKELKEVVEIEIDITEPRSKENRDILPEDKSEQIEKEPSQILEEKQDDEFHAIYRSFIDLCFKLENSDDMNKIVEKKIKTYYKQCPKEYVESEEFIDLVSTKIHAMKAEPDKMYLYIKDVVDELNLQRKMAKSVVTDKENIIAEISKAATSGEESEYDIKRKRQIRKLEKTIKKLHRAIQKLEEQEVDFDDEDDSVFLLTERYKERLVRVHAKFCQLTSTKMPSEPRIVIDALPGRPSGPAKKLEKFINKKVPIGMPLPFPDFHDVLRCVREANNEDKLGWSEMEIKFEAQDLFTRCGRKLQRRRQENEWRIMTSRISMDVDPAEKSDQLKKRLNENMAIAAKKEAELLNKFVDRQNQLKLEPVEIGDKEAEESPLESEDDIQDEGSSLESKQKRKERLKRLLQEKVQNTADENISKSSEKEDQENKLISNKNNGSTNINENCNKSVEEAIKTDEAIDLDGDSNNDDGEDMPNTNNDIESDIDELHLLQKLHSRNEMNSSSTSSESSLSDSDVEYVKNSRDDVISIENSSYSETETVKEDYNDKVQTVCRNRDIDAVDGMEVDTSVDVNVESSKQNNDSEDMENILLASSEEEVTSDKDIPLDDGDMCINLKDDTLSITENVLEESSNDKSNKTNPYKVRETDNKLREAGGEIPNVIPDECDSQTSLINEHKDDVQEAKVISDESESQTSLFDKDKEDLQEPKSISSCVTLINIEKDFPHNQEQLLNKEVECNFSSRTELENNKCDDNVCHKDNTIDNISVKCNKT